MDIVLDNALDRRRTPVRAVDENPPDASGAGVAIFIFQSRT
ncbi:hypothetical protein ALQ72_100913 [Pseudomonas syringae pv. maculicola]|nr:hypothetical protein ALQ85_102627 [Pseudomonas syringae]RMM79520.1 hypothetical protein ALQ72_100913 [Pseudomonas syringae pv. maculicola]